jgi:hypothetical protein
VAEPGRVPDSRASGSRASGQQGTRGSRASGATGHEGQQGSRGAELRVEAEIKTAYETQSQRVENPLPGPPR